MQATSDSDKNFTSPAGIFVQQQCNLIPTSDWIEATFKLSELGDTGASYMLGALYLEFGVADRAFDFFQRSAAQIETSSNNTYLNRQIISGELNPKERRKN